MQIKKFLSVLCAAGVVSTLAACGASSDSSGSTTNGGTPASGSGNGVAAAKQLVEKATALTGWDWAMPTESFDPGSNKVADISLGASIPAQQALSKFVMQAVSAIGWNGTEFDGKASTATIGNYVTQAVSQGYKAIVLQSVDVNAIKAPVDQALAAGVAISCVSCLSNGYQDKIHDVSPDWDMQGQEIAAYIMAQTDGKAKVLGFPDSEFPAVTKRMVALGRYLKSNCPDCTYKTTNFTLDQLGSPVPPVWSASLSQNPPGSLTDVVAPYDDAAALFAKAEKQAGRRDIRINSMDITIGSAPLFVDGSYPLGATVVSPYEYEAWSSVDQVARQLAGKKSWDSTKTPSPIVDHHNASNFTQGTFNPTDFDYRSKFLALWGKK